jgi:wyosine [tRNA(Phe)-imidazoG37] synthetase (radical SAM superfamily)
MNSFVFGPVPSRRLGYSLGVDIIPRKYCNFDCIYCQIGKTRKKNAKRTKFFSIDEVVKEIVDATRSAELIDYVTFSGSGEPTLNQNLGHIIKSVKKFIQVPIAVITNSSLLSLAEVRNDLMNADVILPSLDAGSADIFNRINRPQADISLMEIVNGLKTFRKQYSGLIWLEIMLIKGINDTDEELHRLKEFINGMHVDKIHLNTVTRPPSEELADPVDLQELIKIMNFFGNTCEVISSFEKEGIHEEQEGWAGKIYETLKRRSLTMTDIIRVTGASASQIENELRNMEEKGSVMTYRLGNETYFTARNNS